MILAVLKIIVDIQTDKQRHFSLYIISVNNLKDILVNQNWQVIITLKGNNIFCVIITFLNNAFNKLRTPPTALWHDSWGR